MSMSSSLEIDCDMNEPEETGIWRNSNMSQGNLKERPEMDIGTIFDLLEVSCRRWNDSPCFGTREVVKIHSETEKDRKWLFYELGGYEYRSYTQVMEEVLAVGSGLRKLGLREGDNMVLYAETSYLPSDILTDIGVLCGKSWPTVL